MKKVESITVPIIKEIRDAISDTIARIVKEQFGLDARLGNASYTDKSVTFKLEVKAEGVSKQDQELAKLMGWPDVGTEFKNAGVTFKVVGYNPKKRAYPIVCANPDGKNLLFRPEGIEQAVKREALLAGAKG